MKLRYFATGKEENLERCVGDACSLCHFQSPDLLIVQDDGKLDKWHTIPEKGDHDD